jgi:hypothetical protein
MREVSLMFYETEILSNIGPAQNITKLTRFLENSCANAGKNLAASNLLSRFPPAA